MPAKSHKLIAPNAPQTHAEKFHFEQKKRRIPVSIAVCRALPFVKCRLLLSFFCILPTAFLAEFCTAKCVCANCQWLHYNKIPQKNGGYPLVSPFVLHCFMCSNYFVLSCLFFSILSFCPLVSLLFPLLCPFTTVWQQTSKTVFTRQGYLSVTVKLTVPAFPKETQNACKKKFTTPRSKRSSTKAVRRNAR